MPRSSWIVLLAACLWMACSADTSSELAPSPTAAAPVSTFAPPIATSLACGDGTFTKVRVENEKARVYEDCSLTDKAEGVIWLATAEGHALEDAGTRLTFKDDRGRPFGNTCWTRSGTINGVTQTQLILFGPADSKAIEVCCGDSCVDAEVE